ncbi:hypothetical protein [Thauera sp. SDU_THAU2]|uniref:hypothetical protein n=1 Tax=Thauera sp. SDU_THAU2 TaxID=3136633 RepID=UPI00311E19AC
MVQSSEQFFRRHAAAEVMHDLPDDVRLLLRSESGDAGDSAEWVVVMPDFLGKGKGTVGFVHDRQAACTCWQQASGAILVPN